MVIKVLQHFDDMLKMCYHHFFIFAVFDVSICR